MSELAVQGSGQEAREHGLAGAEIGELEASEGAAQQRGAGGQGVGEEDDAAQVTALVGAEGEGVGHLAKRSVACGLDLRRRGSQAGCFVRYGRGDGARRCGRGDRCEDRWVDAADAWELEGLARGAPVHEQAVDAVAVGGAAGAQLGGADQALGGTCPRGQLRGRGCGCLSGHVKIGRAARLGWGRGICGWTCTGAAVQREAFAQAHTPASRSACSRFRASLRSSARSSSGRSMGAWAAGGGVVCVAS